MKQTLCHTSHTLTATGIFRWTAPLNRSLGHDITSLVDVIWERAPHLFLLSERAVADGEPSWDKCLVTNRMSDNLFELLELTAADGVTSLCILLVSLCRKQSSSCFLHVLNISFPS